jgi:hypothetical protein
MIQITSADVVAKSGMGDVQMKVSESYPSQNIELNPSGETVPIAYHDPTEGYNTVWQNYFSDSQVFTTASPNPCSVSTSPSLTLTIPAVTRVVIKSYKIEVLSP